MYRPAFRSLLVVAIFGAYCFAAQLRTLAADDPHRDTETIARLARQFRIVSYQFFRTQPTTYRERLSLSESLTTEATRRADSASDLAKIETWFREAVAATQRGTSLPPPPQWRAQPESSWQARRQPASERSKEPIASPIEAADSIRAALEDANLSAIVLDDSELTGPVPDGAPPTLGPATIGSFSSPSQLPAFSDAADSTESSRPAGSRGANPIAVGQLEPPTARDDETVGGPPNPSMTEPLIAAETIESIRNPLSLIMPAEPGLVSSRDYRLLREPNRAPLPIQPIHRPAAPPAVQRGIPEPVPSKALATELPKRSSTTRLSIDRQVEFPRRSDNEPPQPPIGTPQVLDVGPSVNTEFLKKRLESTNQEILSLEDQLLIRNDWTAKELSVVIDRTESLLQTQSMLRLYLKNITPDEAERIDRLATMERLVDFIHQRLFETQVAHGTRPLNIGHDRTAEYLDQLVERVNAWKIRN